MTTCILFCFLNLIQVFGESSLGTILGELIKVPRVPNPGESTKRSERDQIPPNLSFPHFYLDGSTLNIKKKDASETPFPIRTLPSSGLQRPSHIPDLSQGLTTPRFDLDTGLLSNPQGKRHHDPLATLFLRPGKFIQFSIAYFDINTGLAYVGHILIS